MEGGGQCSSYKVWAQRVCHDRGAARRGLRGLQGLLGAEDADGRRVRLGQVERLDKDLGVPLPALLTPRRGPLTATTPLAIRLRVLI